MNNTEWLSSARLVRGDAITRAHTLLIPTVTIVGLVDRARERRDAIARRYGVEKVYDDLDGLLAAEVPDIVSAVVPVGQNYPCVTACARAGVRVVSCEKPISHELHEADEMIRICREHGTLFGCAQAGWATPHMPEVVEWVRQGHIGRLTAAAIPGGLPTEVSGGGCVQIAALRILTGMDVEWVEGYTLPAVPGYVAEGTPVEEGDVPAYGRLGLSGGIVCEVVAPEPDGRVPTFISVVRRARAGLFGAPAARADRGDWRGGFSGISRLFGSASSRRFYLYDRAFDARSSGRH